MPDEMASGDLSTGDNKGIGRFWGGISTHSALPFLTVHWIGWSKSRERPNSRNVLRRLGATWVAVLAHVLAIGHVGGERRMALECPSSFATSRGGLPNKLPFPSLQAEKAPLQHGRTRIHMPTYPKNAEFIWYQSISFVVY